MESEEVQLLPLNSDDEKLKIVNNYEYIDEIIDDEKFIKTFENSDESEINGNNMNPPRRSDEPTELSFEKCKFYFL